MGESILRHSLDAHKANLCDCRKGVRLLFLNQKWEMSGNTNTLGDARGGPGKELSFLFNRYVTIELHYAEMWYNTCKSTCVCRCPVCFREPLKIRDLDSFALLIVPITASGLQGEQPLVDELMYVREVGILGP